MRNFRQWGRNHCICSLEIAQDFREAVHASGRHRRLAALQKIIAGETDNWSGPLRSGWTRFILSLLFRNPEALATIKGHIIQMWDEGTKALQADYAARRRAGDPETVEEFLAKHEPNAAQIDAANFLADVIDNDRVGKTVLEMKWSRIRLEHMAQNIAVAKPAMAIDRESRMIGNLVIEIEPAEPPISQVQLNLLAQPPLEAAKSS